MGDIVNLASCEHHFNRVHENVVQYPCKNISITDSDCMNTREKYERKGSSQAEWTKHNK